MLCQPIDASGWPRLGGGRAEQPIASTRSLVKPPPPSIETSNGAARSHDWNGAAERKGLLAPLRPRPPREAAASWKPALMKFLASDRSLQPSLHLLRGHPATRGLLCVGAVRANAGLDSWTRRLAPVGPRRADRPCLGWRCIVRRIPTHSGARSGCGRKRRCDWQFAL